MLKILHVIPTLGKGGAEGFLAQLVARTSGVLRHEIVTLLESPTAQDAATTSAVRISTLQMTRRGLDAGAVGRLTSQIRTAEPDIVHAWMYHANLLCGIAVARTNRKPPLIVSLRRTMDRRRMGMKTYLVAKAGAYIARRYAAAVISCTEAVQMSHLDAGYSAANACVIPNGYDTDALRPDPSSGLKLRECLGIPATAYVIGMAARLHPIKRHDIFMAAAAQFASSHSDAHFLLCGTGIVSSDNHLRELIARHRLEGRVHMLGELQDMASFYNALNIHTLCSDSEGFPNVVAEAMSCGVINVVSAVGNAPELVRSSGLVVAPGSIERLLAAWERIYHGTHDELELMRCSARRRLVADYAIQSVADRYRQLYQNCAAQR